MKLPRGMTRKRRRFFGRLYQNGVEKSIALGEDRDKAIDAFYRAKAGIAPRAGIVTVAEAGKRWLAEYIGTARNEKGQKMAAVRFEAGFAKFLGEKPVRELTRADLRSYRLWLETKRKDLSTQTVAHYLGDARCLLRWCEDAELVDRAPVPHRLQPRIQEKPPDRLSDEEVEVLVTLPDPWGYVLRLALATGLRWGELTRATRQDVTPDGWLLVHHTKSARIRKVPLDRDILAEILTRRCQLVPYAERSPGSFTATVRRLVRKQIKTLAKDEREALSGLSKTFHMHQCRHTRACQWIEGGGSLDSLQAILGHQDQRTTRRYGQPSDRYVREEALRVHASRTGNKTGNAASHPR